MNNREELELHKDAINYIIECQAYFERYEYFKKELWRKVEGRKNTDAAEVRVFFTHLWLHHKFPTIWTSTCGCAWSTMWTGYDPITGEAYTNENDNPVTGYFKEFKDIQEDFAKWQYEDYCKNR